MTDLKRYNVVLPQVLYDELKSAADRRHVTVIELLRQFIKLGLVVIDIENKQDAELVIREGDKERRIVLL